MTRCRLCARALSGHETARGECKRRDQCEIRRRKRRDPELIAGMERWMAVLDEAGAKLKGRKP